MPLDPGALAAIAIIALSAVAAALFVWTLLPVPWAILVAIGLAAGAILLIKDTRDNRAM